MSGDIPEAYQGYFDQMNGAKGKGGDISIADKNAIDAYLKGKKNDLNHTDIINLASTLDTKKALRYLVLILEKSNIIIDDRVQIGALKNALEKEKPVSNNIDFKITGGYIEQRVKKISKGSSRIKIDWGHLSKSKIKIAPKIKNKTKIYSLGFTKIVASSKLDNVHEIHILNSKIVIPIQYNGGEYITILKNNGNFSRTIKIQYKRIDRNGHRMMPYIVIEKSNLKIFLYLDWQRGHHQHRRRRRGGGH